MNIPILQLIKIWTKDKVHLTIWIIIPFLIGLILLLSEKVPVYFQEKISAHPISTTGVLLISGTILIGVIASYCRTIYKVHATSGAESKKHLVNTNKKHRRAMIKEWRSMVKHIITEHDKTGNNISYLLERNKSFYSLKPHLSNDTVRQISKTTEFAYGPTVPAPIRHILNDISKLEQKWKL